MAMLSTARVSTIWIMLLTIASTVTTVVLGCAAPFTALAALAATQMRTRDGVWLMLATWVVNQAIGFGLLQYPHTPKTLAWGLAIGMAAVGCAVAARRMLGRITLRSEIAQVAAAFVIATIAFKLVILLWSFALGGVTTALSPTILARQLLRNGAILVGLYAFYRAVVALGLPSADRNAHQVMA